MHFFYKKHEQRKAITSKPQPKSQPKGWKVCRECHSEAHALKDNLSEVQRDEEERETNLGKDHCPGSQAQMEGSTRSLP